MNASFPKISNTIEVSKSIHCSLRDKELYIRSAKNIAKCRYLCVVGKIATVLKFLVFVALLSCAFIKIWEKLYDTSGNLLA